MKRAAVREDDIDRLRELTNEAGLGMRLLVDIDGEATFSAAGLGTFDQLLDYERALADLGRAA